LDSLLFADNDPAITQAPATFDGPLGTQLRDEFGDFSRSAQLTQLKRLNQAAHRTYCNTAQDPNCPTAAVRRLVEHWYGGADQNGNLIGSFSAATAPPGWRNGEAVLTPDPNDPPNTTVNNPNTAEDLYRQVFGPNCRMCHTSIVDPALRFTDYQRFIGARAQMENLVFARGVMPAARLTMDRFWVPFAGGQSAGALLAQHLAALNPGGPALSAPGAATAVVDGFAAAPNRNTGVRVDGSRSLFANAFQWTLTAPAGSQAVLVGSATNAPSFYVDRPGTYTVALVVNPGTTSQAQAQQSQTVVNRVPTAVDDGFPLTLANGTTLQATVFEGPTIDSDPDGDTLTAAAIPAQSPTHGSVTINGNGSFTYTCTCPNIFQPPAATDSFGYRISDGFGGTADATVTVSLIGAPDTIRPSTPTNLSVTDISTATGDTSNFRLRLQWTASTDNNQITGYRVYRDGVPFLVASTATSPATVTFDDVNRAPDTTYTYQVSALDGQNESFLSLSDSEQTDTSLRQNIQTGWALSANGLSGNLSIWDSVPVQTCTDCHGGNGNLFLDGTADQVRANLFAASEAEPTETSRVNLVTPTNSLIYCKPANLCAGSAHGGGQVLAPGDARRASILRWIQDGAPNN
jgi:VCBS repeat-containing protein